MNSRNLLWQLPLLMLVLMPLWWKPAARMLRVESEVAHGTAQQKSSFVMNGVVLSQANKGREEVFLKAKKLSSNDDQSVLYLNETDATFFDNAKKPVHLKGGNAVYRVDREILTVMNDVVVTTTDMVMTTTVMRYLAKYRKLKSAADVEVLGDGMNITGTSFMYDLSSGSFRVGSRVRCRLW